MVLDLLSASWFTLELKAVTDVTPHCDDLRIRKPAGAVAQEVIDLAAVLNAVRVTLPFGRCAIFEKGHPPPPFPVSADDKGLREEAIREEAIREQGSVIRKPLSHPPPPMFFRVS
jgi:hypothetical protein